MLENLRFHLEEEDTVFSKANVSMFCDSLSR